MTTTTVRAIVGTIAVAAIATGAFIWLKRDATISGGTTVTDHSMHSETLGTVGIDIDMVDSLKSGEPQTVTFKLSNGAQILKRSDLTETHEKLLHFVVVDAGLTDFNHLHPTLADDGLWTQSVTFQHGGQYLMFAEGQAKGGSFAARREVKVAGTPRQDNAAFAVSLNSKADASEAKILNPDALMTEMDSSVRVQVTPAEGWQPYLGAPGHLILIDKDGQEFVHAHPTKMEGGVAEFHATFKKSGPYRAWAQFQRDGRVLTFPFTIEVIAGKPSDQGHSEHM